MTADVTYYLRIVADEIRRAADPPPLDATPMDVIAQATRFSFGLDACGSAVFDACTPVAQPHHYERAPTRELLLIWAVNLVKTAIAATEPPEDEIPVSDAFPPYIIEHGAVLIDGATCVRLDAITAVWVEDLTDWAFMDPRDQTVESSWAMAISYGHQTATYGPTPGSRYGSPNRHEAVWARDALLRAIHER